MAETKSIFFLTQKKRKFLKTDFAFLFFFAMYYVMLNDDKSGIDLRYIQEILIKFRRYPQCGYERLGEIVV